MKIYQLKIHYKDLIHNFYTYKHSHLFMSTKKDLEDMANSICEWAEENYLPECECVTYEIKEFDSLTDKRIGMW